MVLILDADDFLSTDCLIKAGINDNGNAQAPRHKAKAKCTMSKLTMSIAIKYNEKAKSRYDIGLESFLCGKMLMLGHKDKTMEPANKNTSNGDKKSGSTTTNLVRAMLATKHANSMPVKVVKTCPISEI